MKEQHCSKRIYARTRAYQRRGSYSQEGNAWGHKLLLISLCLYLSSAGGLACGPKLKPVILGPKTQLENQILGTFQRLEVDMILASSVRGEAEKQNLSPLAREALEALMVREFYREDIDELKSQQLVGENSKGLLTILTPPTDVKQAAHVKNLVDAENHSRQVIMRRVIQLNPDLKDQDLPLVMRIFYHLNRQTAKPGEKVERETGGWEVIPQAELPGSLSLEKAP